MSRERPRRRRGLLLGAGLVLVVALVASAGVWSGVQGGEDGEWIEVQRRDLVSRVEIAGELQAVESIQLGPPQLSEHWNFSIAFLAPEGTKVEAGAPVLGFDTSSLQADLLTEETARAAAQQQLETLRRQFDLRREEEALQLAEAQAKVERLAIQVDVPPELAAARELQTLRMEHRLALDEVAYREERVRDSQRQAEADLAAQEATWREAEAKVEELRSQIQAMMVKTPRAGTVIHIANWRGEKPKVSDNIWRNQKVVEIPELSALQARGMVDEDQAGRLREGQGVTLFLDAHPDDMIQARVLQIDRNVRRRAWHTPLKAVRLTLELEQTDPDRMRPGMRFRGQVEVDRLDAVPTVPLTSVETGSMETGTTAAGNEPRVRVRDRLGARWRTVQLGQRDESWVQVLSGVDVGEQVWLPTAGAQSESDGGGESAVQLPGAGG